MTMVATAVENKKGTNTDYKKKWTKRKANLMKRGSAERSKIYEFEFLMKNGLSYRVKP